MYTNVNQLIMITATPEMLFRNYNGINLLPVKEITNPNYVRLNECPFNPFNPTITKDDDEYVDNTYYALEYFKTNKINYGDVYFIPTSVRRKDHDEIENMLIENGIANVVIKINALKKQITVVKEYFPNGKITIPFKEIEGSTNKELSTWLGDYYETHNGSTQWKLAITGNICVSRGISIQSPQCSISHAIYGPAINDMPRANKYQIGARILGNIRNFPKIVTKGFPIIICQESTYEEINRRYPQACVLSSLLQFSKKKWCLHTWHNTKI